VSALGAVYSLFMLLSFLLKGLWIYSPKWIVSQPGSTTAAKDSEYFRPFGIPPHPDAHSSGHPLGTQNIRDFGVLKGRTDRGRAKSVPPAPVRAERVLLVLTLLTCGAQLR
jgi:hypothetical protein